MSPLFTRRPRLPDPALAALDLARRERVLAFADLGPGILVATDQRLTVVADAELLGARPWHDVDTASWDGDTSTLAIHWVDAAPPWSFACPEPDRDLMTTIRARVQSTLVTTHTTKVNGRTIRAILRRDLATDELLLQHQYAHGTVLRDPRVTAAVARLDDLVREEAGLPADFT